MAKKDFNAANLTAAIRKARELMVDGMGDDYAPRNRKNLGATSFITVYRNKEHPEKHRYHRSVGAPCHGSHLLIPQSISLDEWERLFNLTLPSIQKWDDEHMTANTLWYDYILNRAPFSHVYRTKRADLFIERGAIMLGGNNSITECHFALVASRSPSEYPDVPVIFEKLVKLGLNEHTAFATACFTRLDKSATKNPRLLMCSRGHMMLTPTSCNFLNYLKWDRTADNTDPYHSAIGYWGVDAQFGETLKASRFETVIEDFLSIEKVTDAWGDKVETKTLLLDKDIIKGLDVFTRGLMKTGA